MDFVYFDHNVIRDMAGGYVQPLKDLLFQKLGLRLFYSTENLEEIRRAPEKYHSSTLAFLRETKAVYASMASDFASVNVNREIDPEKAFADYCDAVTPYSNLDYSMHGFLLKYFGTGESWEDISRKEGEEISRLLIGLVEDLHAETDLPSEVLNGLYLEMQEISRKVEDTAKHLGQQFQASAADSFGAAAMQEQYGIGPDILDRITEPDVIVKVWEKIKKPFEAEGLSCDQVFGIAPVPGVEVGHELSVVQKVNVIYHQLNLFGYKRDKDLKGIHGHKRSLSDSTHAGYALFSKLFVCRDDRLVKKAVAAYEYLGLRNLGVLQVLGNPRVDAGPIRLNIAWPKISEQL